METKTKRMISLIVLYDIQTKYFGNVLDGISDKDIHNRLSTKANHIAWLAGSLVQQRYEIAHMLGIKNKPAADDLFKNNKGIQDDVVYPSLSVYKKDWDTITPLLKDALLNIADEKLDESFEMMPGMKMTYYDLVTFMSYREASCIGQIALWRRLLGYPAMSYM